MMQQTRYQSIEGNGDEPITAAEWPAVGSKQGKEVA
jgi:hypothetical protein